MTMTLIHDDKTRGIYARTAVGRCEEDIIKAIAGNPILFGTMYCSDNSCSLVKQAGQKNAYMEIEQLEADLKLYNVIIYSAGNDLKHMQDSLDFLVNAIQLKDPFCIGRITLQLLGSNTERFLERYFETYAKKQ
jgi:hypothetical protein